MLRKICEVFTKEYRKETEYIEFMSKMINHFRLNDDAENIEDKVARLQKKGFLIRQNIYLIFITTKNLHNMIDYYIVFVKKGDFCYGKN